MAATGQQDMIMEDEFVGTGVVWVGQIQVQDGRCMIAPKRQSTGSRPTLDKCRTSNMNNQWVYDAATGLMKSEHGLCLDAPQPSQQGTKVHMWKCYRSLTSQQWDYDNRTQLLKNRKGGLCLEAAGTGARPHRAMIGVDMCRISARMQMWTLQGFEQRSAVGGVRRKDVFTGPIRIKNGRCLDSQEPRKNGGELIVKDCGLVTSQQWVHDTSTGSIWNLAGSCLDEYFNEKGGEVHMWKCYSNIKTQQWDYYEKMHLLVNRRGFCLAAASTWPHNVNTEECDPSAAEQKWIMDLPSPGGALGPRAPLLAAVAALAATY